jgi:hypothetical protein
VLDLTLRVLDAAAIAQQPWDQAGNTVYSVARDGSIEEVDTE